MSRNSVKTTQRILTVLLLVAMTSSPLLAQRTWKRQEVDVQAGNGRRIKAIRYPANQQPKLQAEAPTARTQAAAGQFGLNSTLAASSKQSAAAVSAMTLEVQDPPVAGFVPWIAVGVTREREGELELDAVVEPSLKGLLPKNVHLETDYTIGIFDTGASAHVMGYASARSVGVYSGPNLLTSNESVISGVVGEVFAYVSQPLGVFLDGLGAIDANTAQLNTSYMKGQSNVAIMVGQQPYAGSPDLPTAIGAPMSVYYTTHFRNDTQVTVMRDDVEYQGPDIILYDSDDESAPSYDNIIPLELRPLGAASVQYIPTVDMGLGGLGDLGDLDDILDGLGGGASDFPPSTPSILVGIGSQSLFFIHSVDLFEGSRQALDKTRFMLDTGAQVSVIGSRIAARLGLSAALAEFEVEIEGVTGQSIMAPGFTIDSLEIPALGEWFRATNVPVVWLDVSSPEGGTLDGIIGMNLFTEFNLILKGGGLMLKDDPSLQIQRISSTPVDVNEL